MAQLSQALPTVLANEGFYSCDPSDPGGETYCGISRRAWPNWAGWVIIDHHKILEPSFGALNAHLKADGSLNALVTSFYQAEFWKYDGVQSQVLATKVLDCCVNLGQTRGMSICQRAAGVIADGKYGALTEGAFNGSPEAELLDDIRNRLITYYENLAESKPVLKKFLNGWRRRAKQ